MSEEKPKTVKVSKEEWITSVCEKLKETLEVITFNRFADVICETEAIKRINTWKERENQINMMAYMLTKGAVKKYFVVDHEQYIYAAERASKEYLEPLFKRNEHTIIDEIYLGLVVKYYRPHFMKQINKFIKDSKLSELMVIPSIMMLTDEIPSEIPKIS